MPELISPADLEKLRHDIVAQRDPNKPCIAICAGTGCLALGCDRVITAFKEEVRKQGLEGAVYIRETGCPGFCENGTVVTIYPEGILYVRVQPEDAAEIISHTISRKKVVDRLLYIDPATNERIIYEKDVPFYKYQTRILLGDNSKLDAKSLDDYLALGGYSALSKALCQMSSEQVLEEVAKSNLRGRGGGGFPTHKKWDSVRSAPGEPKYAIVNCDEGDPGAFMNRALMEGNPHSVIEGLTIGAYAIGAEEGFIYVRAEYPLAVENVTAAIAQAEAYGLLGGNILDSGFDFKVTVHRGAGAFVSGESSALMKALEGQVGEPRPKYVHTSEKGLWDKPSALNNVETWANIPLIINNGADWFKSIGTEGNTGTKIFALVGKVNNTGLVEVPLGTTLRHIIYRNGGGIRGGKRFRAVQTGGPSGGCIPAEFLDSPVDFDELARLGSMMGSGGMIVMDENTCMVDTARYFLDFLSDESCGKCTACREGIRQMLNTLTRICQGKGEQDDLDLLRELAEVLKDTALCALGQTSPNPILTTLRYFADEYREHIEQKKCSAFVCKDLVAYYIDPARCKACLICLRNCPVSAIDGDKGRVHVIDQSKCIKCGVCFELCPQRFDAVTRISGEPVPPPPSEQDRIIVKTGRQ